MFCSTVIATIGRPELSRAVYSVLGQAFAHDDFEVIVVNDSGRPLPETDWQWSERVQVIYTQRRERCVARNAGAAMARGRYLHFLDDDDWLLPDALENFWTLAQASDAIWLYGASQLVDRAGKPLIRLHHGMKGNCFIQVMAGEWIPLQASLIKADTFFAIGGFNPLIPGGEDIDLARRIALRGRLAFTPATVACVGIGTEGSTTDYARAAQNTRRARELVLSESGAFARMFSSASSNYWHGRVVRAYLSSLFWNLRRGHIFVAVGRAVMGLASLVLAAPHLISRRFWHAVARSYDSETFLRGFREANRPVERRDISNLHGEVNRP